MNVLKVVNVKSALARQRRAAARGLGIVACALIISGCAVLPPQQSAPRPAPPPMPPQAQPAPDRGDGVLMLRGHLNYRARSALARDSVAVTQLRDPRGGHVIAEAQQSLAGAQVPIPFALTIPRGEIRPTSIYELRARIEERGRATWTSDVIPVRLAGPRIDVGVVQMRQQVEPPGSDAMLPPSTTTPPPGGPVLRARGNEPAWTLELSNSLRFMSSDRLISGVTPAVRAVGGVRRYVGRVGSGEEAAMFNIAINPNVCRDSMSGMPHPFTVIMTVDGHRFRGCGGEPVALLAGAEWVVESVAGSRLDQRRATLRFLDNGRVSGQGPCNTFTAIYTLTGEVLTIGRAAVTRRACEPAVMTQERRFFEVLQAVRGFDINARGVLVLTDERGRNLTARRS